ncbi:MAG: ABC transporter permease [Clostridia bacterium]|nr:ABC transporter permease [Clostridia bacterium]
MGLLESLRLSLEGLKSNKMRAVLTMLGIIIGIAAVIGILTVGDGLSGSITGTMSSFGASTVTVSLRQKDQDAPGVTEEDLISMEMIEEMKIRYGHDIAHVSLSQSVGSGQAKDGRLYANVSVSGVNTDYFPANETELLAGRFLKDRDMEGQRMICVVSDKLVNNMFGGDLDAALGEEITVEYMRDTHRFRIVGVYEYEQSAFSFSMASEKDISTSVYIPLTTAKALTNAADGFSNITVMAAPDADGGVVAQELQSFLNRYYRRNDHYSVFALSMDSMIESVNDVMDTLSIAISVIAAISLLVGGIGVMNIMLVSVTERTREIGTRKALGATNANIRLQFVVESAMICLVGGVIGIILGAIMGYIGSSLLEAPTLPGIDSIAIAVGFSLAVGIFFGYYPANKAAKLDPIEALRYE